MWVVVARFDVLIHVSVILLCDAFRRFVNYRVKSTTPFLIVQDLIKILTKNIFQVVRFCPFVTANVRAKQKGSNKEIFYNCP